MSIAKPAETSVLEKVTAFGSLIGSGTAGGLLGGLVGLGAHGSSIMVPVMKSMANYSHAVATGTASVAVVSTGIAGCIGFASAGLVDPAKLAFGKVDVVTAGFVGVGAAIGARYGSLITGKVSPILLRKSFGVVQIVLAPLVLAKPMYDSYVKAEKEKAEAEAAKVKKMARRGSVVEWGGTYTNAYKQTERFFDLLRTSPPIGLAAGAIFGTLGVGGGAIIAPCLGLLTDLDHATVLGTTLAAMLPASVMSALAHARAGYVCLPGAVPLVIATAVGAYAGSQLAVELPEEVTKPLFAAVIFGLGVRRFRSPPV